LEPLILRQLITLKPRREFLLGIGGSGEKEEKKRIYRKITLRKWTFSSWQHGGPFT
jgi:hypothetical protein